MLKGQFQNFLINRICQIPLMFLQGDISSEAFVANALMVTVQGYNYVAPTVYCL